MGSVLIRRFDERGLHLPALLGSSFPCSCIHVDDLLESQMWKVRDPNKTGITLLRAHIHRFCHISLIGIKALVPPTLKRQQLLKGEFQDWVSWGPQCSWKAAFNRLRPYLNWISGKPQKQLREYFKGGQTSLLYFFFSLSSIYIYMSIHTYINICVCIYIYIYKYKSEMVFLIFKNVSTSNYAEKENFHHCNFQNPFKKAFLFKTTHFLIT